MDFNLSPDEEAFRTEVRSFIAEHLPEITGRGAAEAPAPGPTQPTGRKVVAAAPLKIKRTPGQWMSFKCSCGATNTLSPGFAAKRMQCKKCGRTIEIE